MRSLRLMGEEVLPAVREMAQELDLPGPFDLPESSEPVGIRRPQWLPFRARPSHNTRGSDFKRCTPEREARLSDVDDQ